MKPAEAHAIVRLAAGRFRLTIDRVNRDGPVQLEVTFRMPAGYLDPFFRYAHRPDTSAPFTFPHFQFNPDPPGRRIGPWPGWRGIPVLPEIGVESAQGSVSGAYFFLGDEEATGLLRASFTLEAHCGKEVLLTVADDRLQALSVRALPGGITKAAARPIMLRTELIDRHPRLLFAAPDLAAIRDKRRSSHRDHFRRLVDLLSGADLPFEVSPESKALPGPERLSPEDRLLLHTMVALADPGRDTLRIARKALRRHLPVAARDDYPPMGIDTQSGEALFIACLAYDWLHEELSQTDRRNSRRALRRMAGICRRHLGPERRDYGQAHYLGCGLGLLAYSFLMWETDPEAPGWAAELRGAFDQVAAMLPPDGAYPHGINLWIYEYGFILRWLELIRHCTGEDLWKASRHFSRASAFRAAATSADRIHGVTFGDPQYRVAGDSWCHFLIAARTGSTAARALGNQLLDQPPESIDHRHIPPRRRVYEFLWDEPGKRAGGLKDGARFFPDTGQFFLRRSDQLLTVRCGPPLGRRRRSAGERGGYGHSDPCQGAFLIWAGDQFVASGPGPVYRRDTGMHNTITVDGRGQAGDGCVWAPDFLPPEFIPEMPEVISEKNETILRMDLTPTYLRDLGVVRHVRTLRIDAGMNIIGKDEIRLTRPRRIGWHFHTWCPVRIVRDDENPEFLLGSLCRVAFRRSARTRLSHHLETFVPAYPHDGKRGREIIVRRMARATVFNWRLSWDP